MDTIRYRPELDWQQIVYSEIVAVTNAMRRNQRWSMESKIARKIDAPRHLVDSLDQFAALAAKRKGMGQSLPPPQENALIYEFTKLKSLLGSVTNLRDLDPSRLLLPFLQVIKSGDTTGNITGVALNSVYNFINYRILDPHHPDLGSAVIDMTHAVTRCKFEAIDVVSDEIVLTRILRLLRTMAQSEIGRKCISDKGICEMVEVAFGMHFQSRISELLRKAAEDTLMVLTQCLFERLVTLTRESEHREAMKEKSAGLRTTQSGQCDSNDDFIATSGSEANGIPPANSITAKTTTSFSFGVPAILEFVRVLITLIDPKDNRHTDTLHRALALKLTTRALEVGGQSLAKWVRAGFALEREMEKTAPNERIDLNGGTNEDMTIVTDQPATVVSVGASGANFTSDTYNNDSVASFEGLADNKEVTANEAPSVGVKEAVINEPMLPPFESKIETPVTPLQDSAATSLDSFPFEAGLAEEQKRETDYRKLAINIKQMIVNDMTKYLFQMLISQNTTNVSPPSWGSLNTIGLILRTISALFGTLKENLIPQRQWFINHLMASCEAGVICSDIDEWADSVTGVVRNKNVEKDPLLPRASVPILVNEVRDLYLESLLQLCRSETFYTELYVYHDTSISDKLLTFEALMKFFAKFSFPDSALLTNTAHQTLSFEGILLFLRTISERKGASSVKLRSLSSSSDIDLYAPKQLVANRKRKIIFLKGAEIFNKSLKKGIAFFQGFNLGFTIEHDFLPDPLTPKAMAKFISSHSNLSKAVIGDYLGRPDKANQDTLRQFVELFDFKGRRIDEAMRLFLETFRIPGESQMIERVLDAFSKKYFGVLKDNNDRPIKTEEDTCVLAFSIIMLNTDQHNPQVKRRMTFSDYTRNVRKLNSGDDFNPEYLQSIYHAIQRNEIVLAEERGGDLGFSYEWKELMRNMDLFPDFIGRETNIYDSDLFQLVSGPSLASLFYAFENVQDSSFFEKALAAIHYAAIIAAHYDLNDIFDFIITSLFRISGISKGSQTPLLNADLARSPADSEFNGKNTEKPELQIDRWIIQFGKSFKCQVAAVLAFNIIKEYPDIARLGWKPAVMAMSNLFLHQALPANMLVGDHFCVGKVDIPRLAKPAVIAPQRSSESPKKEQGLFSSFAQFLSLASSDVDDEQEVLQTTFAMKNAKSASQHCSIEDLLAHTRFMEVDAVQRLLAAMIECSFDGEKQSTSFSEAAVFLLDQIFGILVCNRDRLSKLWPIISPHLEVALQAESPVPMLERGSTNIIRLLLRLTNTYNVPDVFKPLEQLHFVREEKLHSFVEHLTAGFLAVARTDMSILSQHPNRLTTLFRALSVSSTHASASSYSFELTCIIVSGHPDSSVTMEHFGECVDLLLSFSTGIPRSKSPVRVTSRASSPSRSKSASPPKKVPVEGGANGIARTPSAVKSPLDRGLIAIERLYNLHLIIPKLIDSRGTQSQRAWFEFWIPVLSGLEQQCSNPAVEIRHQALGFLQRILLSEELAQAANNDPDSQHRVECFDIVLFSLLDELRSLDLAVDMSNGSETLVRACVLVTKVFLRFSAPLHTHKDYIRIWEILLDKFGVLLGIASTRQSEYAMEGIQESLKNAILVLMADKIITETNGDTTNPMWKVTWAKVDQICPTIKNDLWPN